MMDTRIMKDVIDFSLFTVISKSEGPKSMSLIKSIKLLTKTKNNIHIILDF